MTPIAKSQSLAAVFHGPGKPLVLREFTVPEPQAGEALVELTCCTICGSDLHTMQGDRPVAGPTVLGHEMLGHVWRLPRGGTPLLDIAGEPLAIGDRITWSVAASCGTCFFCTHGLPQKCEQLFKYGHEAIDRDPLSGGLAQFCRLQRGSAIVRVPEALSDFVACPANCATATVAGAMRIAGGCADKSVVIHGAGMLGMTTAAMAATQGAASVIVTDLSEQRLARAKEFGATDTVHIGSDASALPDVVRRATGGRGCDVAFEMSGAASAFEQAVDILRIGGQLVLVGAVFPTRAARLPPEQIVRKLLRIEGAHNYAPIDLESAIDFLVTARERYPFESLVESEVNLTDLSAAVQRILAADHIRVAVRPR